MTTPMNGLLGDPLQNETKPLDEVMRLAVEGILYNLHTALPCKIVKVRNNSFVDIQPLLQRKYVTGQLVSLPVIQNVQVMHPRGADYWIKLPIAVNDIGFAVFSERSIDQWKLKGYLTDPQDGRRHDLSDAIFFPGAYPMNQVLTGAAADMIIQNKDAQIYLQKAGKFLIKKQGGDELLATESDLAQAVQSLASAVSSLASAVSSGFTTLDPIALAAQIIQATAAGASASSAGSAAGTVKGKVDGLKGSA